MTIETLVDREAIFNERYLEFYRALHDEQTNASQAAGIASLVALRPGSRVLDAPCGYGRISTQLALLGHHVSGVDATTLFLRVAREEAAARGLSIDFQEADLRDLSAFRGFDFVLNWFTSFGYFDDGTNLAILRQFHDALRPGGMLLLDHINVMNLARRFQNSMVREVGDSIMIDRPTLDLDRGRTHAEWLFIRGEERYRTKFSLRIYMPTELRGFLEQAGFHEVRFVRMDGAPLDLESTRMIALAKRPE